MLFNECDHHADQDESNNQDQEPHKPQLDLYLNTFMHAVHCHNADCSYPKCLQFKRVITHSKNCIKYKYSQCDFCRQLLALCIFHANKKRFTF